MPFGFELRDVEVIALADELVTGVPLHQRVDPVAEANVSNAVIRVGVVHRNPVVQFGLFRVFRVGYRVEGGRAAEIAIFAQQVVSNLRADFRIDSADEYRLGCEFLENPLSNLPFFIDKGADVC